MIVDDSVKNTSIDTNTKGFEFEAKLPYYRGVSLSMVEEIEVSLNGKILPQDQVLITVHGNTYNLNERENELDDRWEMGEVAILQVKNSEGLTKGTHQLGLKINLRIGYMPFPSIRKTEKEITIH